MLNAEISLNSELTKCAAISHDLQRLACYDALSGLPSSSHVEALNKKSSTATANKLNDNATVAHSQNSSANNVQSTQSKNEFGLKKKSGEIESISSYIPGKFKGWKNGDKFTLANGQVWKVKDYNGRLYHPATNPKVTISKSLFGTYRINIAGVKKSVHVKRVK